MQEAEAWRGEAGCGEGLSSTSDPLFLPILCPQRRQGPKAEGGRAEVASTAPSRGCPPISPRCKASPGRLRCSAVAHMDEGKSGLKMFKQFSYQAQENKSHVPKDCHEESH